MERIPNTNLLEDLRRAVGILASSVCGLDNIYGINMARRLSPLVDRFESEDADDAIKEIREIFHNINGGILKADLSVFEGADYQVLERINHHLKKT